ncbi:MAG: ArnT family glycosyltransferase [Planctomycetota bacterium]|jgi:hypothetical protein
MTKQHPRNRHLRRQAKTHSQKTAPADTKENQKKLVILLIIAILAAIPFVLGKYIEFNTPGPFDSGAYVYSAKHVLDGAVIGVDEKPSAQLGTLLVNMLGVWLFGFGEIGPEIIQMTLQAAALVMMFIAMRKLFGTLSAAVGVIIASIYLSAPLIAKFGNVKEQYMIAFMIMAISCFVLRQLSPKWWWAALAGAFLSWAPLFKPTGMSAIGAIGLFVIVQPLFKHRTFKQTACEIALLLTGALIAIAPIYVWLLTCHGGRKLPYSFLWKPVISTFQSSQQNQEHKPAETETDDSEIQNTTENKGLLNKLLPGYVTKSWEILKPEEKKEVAFRVLRYYRLLILPIVLAAGAIIARLIRMLMHRMGKLKPESKADYDRFVLLFAVWWLLDMAFIWVSPRTYEQYFLPMNASAAMLGGYLIALYSDRLNASVVHKNRWIVVGITGFICMIALSQHIFSGIQKSPHTNADYGRKSRGYRQKLNEAAAYKKGQKGYWQIVGDYIRENSTPEDKIYVWGWEPGIYIKAQRLCPAPKAFEGTMHTLPPEELSKRINELLTAFRKQPPKFIVDTHKNHFPWDRPPLELWPRTKKGFLPLNKQVIVQYDAEYSKILREEIEPNEALRYEAMAPFREFVMSNYEIVPANFYKYVLFKRISPQPKQ